MGIAEKKKLISMLLMIMTLMLNLALVQVIQTFGHAARFSVASLVESYRSYSEDMTVEESVYLENPLDSNEVIGEEANLRQEQPDKQADVENEVALDDAAEKDLIAEELSKPVRLVFLGDCMMADNMAKAIDQHGVDYPLEDYHWLLEGADIIVANLETAVGTSRILMDKAFPFQTAPTYMSVFKPYREKVVFSLANNHGMDAPLSETMAHMNELGYAYIGVGKDIDSAYEPYLVEINGVTFAIFAASQVMPTAGWRAGPNTPGMAEAYTIEKLMDYISPWIGQVDYTIAYIHWGEELANHPTHHQQALEEALREAGVNLIIGSHPHVLQAFEWHNPKQFTAHSMGNFLFTTSHTPIANETAALELMVTREDIQEARLHFGRIQFGKVHLLRDASERRGLIDRLNKLSRSVWVETDGSMAPR